MSAGQRGIGTYRQRRCMVSEPVVKRQIQHELPDHETLARFGIQVDLETARLILALASRMIVHGRATHRTGLERALRAIGTAVSAELVDEDGFVVEGILARPARALTPTGRAAGKSVGVTSSAFNRAWDDGPVYVTSCLPLKVVLGFLPAHAWPYLEAFIRCGPHEARLRLSVAASMRGKRMTWKSLDAQMSPLQTLMDYLVSLLHDREAANVRRSRAGKPLLEIPPALDSWTIVPKKLTTSELRSKATGGRRRSTSAIPEELVKARLRELAVAAEWGRWEPHAWPLNRNWRALKKLAVFALVSAAAPRVEQLGSLDASDVVLNCRFRDGTLGPAILFRGGDYGLKNRLETYEYAVRLPDELRDILVAWLTCNGSAPATTAASGQIRRARVAPQPLFPARKRKQLGAVQSPHDSLGDFFVGRKETPKSGGSAPLIEDPATPGVGFHAHRFRSTLTQGMDRLMKEWRDANIGLGHILAGYDHECASELTLDHTRADLGYRDFRDSEEPTARFEQLVALGVDLWWAHLWSDGPYLRRGLDPDAIMRAHQKVQLIEAQIEATEGEAAQLKAAARDLRLRALQRAVERDKLQALLESDALRDRRDDALERRDQLRAHLATAQADLTAACETAVVLPENLGEEEHADRVATALAVVLAEPEVLVPREEPALAAEMTIADVAALFGVTPQQAGRWRRGESSPPIAPTAWIKYNEKDFRLPVSAIDDEALRRIPSTNPRRALEKVLADRAARDYGRRTSISGLSLTT